MSFVDVAERDVAAPPEVVFAVRTDVRRWHEWSRWLAWVVRTGLPGVFDGEHRDET